MILNIFKIIQTVIRLYGRNVIKISTVEIIRLEPIHTIYIGKKEMSV